MRTAKDSRRDEWDATTGGRPPTLTADHHLSASAKTTNVAAVPKRQPGPRGRTTPTLQSQLESDTVLLELRDQIRENGLLAGTVVQVFNDANSDEWFLSFTLMFAYALFIVLTGT